MVQGTAIALTNGWLDRIWAKTTHGLLRGSQRFDVRAVVDPAFAGRMTGDIVPRGASVPIYATVEDALANLPAPPDYCIVGVAIHGGKLPATLRGEVLTAIGRGLSVVSGLHSFLGDDPEFTAAAQQTGVGLVDVRRPRPTSELRFWSGEIYQVTTPRIAVLGTDCAVGKRTTTKFIMDACRDAGIHAEMIYTGQTGWMEGHPYGFIFDSTLNDFISGEIERAIMDCDRETHPDLILIEGQSSLRNPSGPCGSEFLISGDARGVILQHPPGRPFYDGLEDKPQGRLATVESEMELIRILGSRTVGITLSEEGWDDAKMRRYQQELQERIGIPVVRPLVDGVTGLIPAIREFLSTYPDGLADAE